MLVAVWNGPGGSYILPCRAVVGEPSHPPTNSCPVQKSLYYIRGGVDPNQLLIPDGADGLPAAHIYYSFTKYMRAAEA